MAVMLCRNPYISPKGQAFGCGQCMPCRYNTRRIWMHRIMLEAMQYEDNAFVTLTYSDDKLPEGATLVPQDLRLFLNRLRSRVASSRFRFFAVGEYGDETERPHYHAALFGFRSCEFGKSRYSFRTNCCYWCDLVRDTWGHGNVYLGRLEDDSAGYVAGYVTKKLNKAGDPRLHGRHPEFGRMSLKPGIGHSAMWDVADLIFQHEKLLASGDVPTQLMHGLKKLPLGRYLRKSLRKMVGRDEKAPEAVLEAIAEELQPMREAAFNGSRSFKKEIVEAGNQAVLNMESRNRVHRKRRSL